MIFLDFDEIKNVLELSKTEADYPNITLFEKIVVSGIENHLQRILTYANRAEKYHGLSNTTKYALKSYPIDVINSVTIDDVAIDLYDQNDPFSIDLYSAIPSNEIVSIDYDGGYKKITDIGAEFDNIEALPDDIYRAIFLQTIYEYQNRDHIGADVVSNEGGSISRPGLQLLNEVKRLLRNHRHAINCAF
jgi:hypothetical protein